LPDRVICVSHRGTGESWFCLHEGQTYNFVTGNPSRPLAEILSDHNMQPYLEVIQPNASMLQRIQKILLASAVGREN